MCLIKLSFYHGVQIIVQQCSVEKEQIVQNICVCVCVVFRLPVQNVPIPVFYPKEKDNGLWGNLGIIKGFRKRDNNPLKARYSKIARRRT